MICISIAQESRRLALVDLHNAAKQCDLVELRLDRFDKAPDVKDLLAHKPKPVIISCRRPKDGGHWQGSEEERLALLRQGMVDGADYVELELDAATQVRPYPKCKRVITYVNLQETPDDLAEVYAEASRRNPDVIKIVTLARTPEEAWPLVQLLAKGTVPTVLVGLGKPGVMLTVLGKKLGAPWTYAALERGMETFPGQPTVADLKDVYDYQGIDKETRFVGVTGFGRTETLTTAMLNAGFKLLKEPVRCLPMAVGEMSVFRKVMSATKLRGVVVDEPNRDRMLSLASKRDEYAEQAHATDLLVRDGKDDFFGYNVVGRAAVAALEATMRERHPSDKPLRDRQCVIVGATGNARIMAHVLHKRGAIPILAARDRDAAHAIAEEVGCRFVPFEALYTTSHDVLILCSHEQMKTKGQTKAQTGVHAGYLKPSHTVLDLTSFAGTSDFLREAQERGCAVVPPDVLLVEQVERQLRAITGQPGTRAKLAQVLRAMSD